MVYVTHHRYNRSARFQIFLIILFLYDGLRHFCAYIFCLEAEFLSHQVDGLGIQTLVNGNHDTDTHTSTDNLRHRNVHHVGKVIGSHKLRQLQHLAFHFFLFHQFVFTLLDGIAFVATVLGTFIILISLVGQTGQGFLYLLLYIFLADFRLHRLA